MMFLRGHSLLYVLLILLPGFVSATEISKPDTVVYQFIIHANADSFFVGVNNRYHYIASGDTLEFTERVSRVTIIARGRKETAVSYSRAAGLVQTHRLWLEHENRPERSRYMVMKTGDNVVIHTAAHTRILIDGEYAGTGMYRSAKPAGHYRVKLVNPNGLSRSVNMKLRNDRLTYLPKTVNSDKKTIMALSLLPGAAQFQKHQPLKGMSFQLAFAAGIAGSYLLNQQFLDSRTEFREIREMYRVAGSDNTAFELGEKMDEAASAVNRNAMFRNLVAGAVVLVYAYNIWDGNRPPRGGFEQINRINPWVDYQPDSGMKAGLTYTRKL
jgi:hypothetical protein